MSGLVSQIKKIFDLGFEAEEDMLEPYEDLADYSNEEEENVERNNKLKVVRHPGARGYEVMVIEPRTFEESLEIVNSLRERKTIVLNLELLDSEQSQRTVDFLSGATHALDGHQQKIGDGVFIFTPSNVAINSETEKARAITDAFWNQAK